MKHWRWLVFLLVFVSGLAACTAADKPEAPTSPGGPGLIMFYTDN